MTIPMKGGAAFEAFLDKLPYNVQKGAARSGVTAVAGVYRDAIRANAPRVSGEYAKKIKTSSANARRNGDVTIRVYVERGGHGNLGHLLEYGVAPHDIEIGPGKVAEFGDDKVSGVISHPGFAAQPHFWSTIDVVTPEAIAAFGVKARESIKRNTGFTAPLVEIAA